MLKFSISTTWESVEEYQIFLRDFNRYAVKSYADKSGLTLYVRQNPKSKIR